MVHNDSVVRRLLTHCHLLFPVICPFLLGSFPSSRYSSSPSVALHRSVFRRQEAPQTSRKTLAGFRQCRPHRYQSTAKTFVVVTRVYCRRAPAFDHCKVIQLCFPNTTHTYPTSNFLSPNPTPTPTPTPVELVIQPSPTPTPIQITLRASQCKQ